MVGARRVVKGADPATRNVWTRAGLEPISVGLRCCGRLRDPMASFSARKVLADPPGVGSGPFGPAASPSGRSLGLATRPLPR